MTLPTRADALSAVYTLLAYIGENPEREGLRETPSRVLASWEECWGMGYRASDDLGVAAHLLKTFEADSDLRYNQMVIVRDISMFSHCEHHMTPFFGSAHIAYVPGERGLVGLSKLARIVDLFARRLQTQERVTTQIADCLSMHLSEHVGVLIEAQHMCMLSRGVRQPRSTTITTALRGDFFNDQATRAEFLSAIRGNKG